MSFTNRKSAKPLEEKQIQQLPSTRPAKSPSLPSKTKRESPQVQKLRAEVQTLTKQLQDQEKDFQARLKQLEDQLQSPLEIATPNVLQMVHFLQSQPCPFLTSKDRTIMLKRLHTMKRKPDRTTLEYRYLPLIHYMVNHPELWLHTNNKV